MDWLEILPENQPAVYPEEWMGSRRRLCGRDPVFPFDPQAAALVLDWIANGGSPSGEGVPVNPATVYAWRSRVPEFDAAYRAAIEMRADWLVAKGEEYATNMDMPASDASLRAKLLFQAAGLRSRRYAPRRGDEDTRAGKASLPELSEEDLLRIVAQGQKKLGNSSGETEDSVD